MSVPLPVHHEFAVDAVEDCFEVVPLPRVFAVEEIQDVHHKGLIDVLLCGLGVGVLTHDVPQKELVHDLHTTQPATALIDELYTMPCFRIVQ